MLTTTDALGITIKLHGVAAAGNMNSTLLDEPDELLRLGPRPYDAAFGCGFVDMRGDDGGGLNQFVECESCFLSLHRKRAHVHHGQIDSVEVLDDALHVAVDGRVTRQVHAKAVGEREHIAIRVTNVSGQAVRSQASLFRTCEQIGSCRVAMIGPYERDLDCRHLARTLDASLASKLEVSDAGCCPRNGHFP